MSTLTTIHIDGAARGNPGPAAASFVIQPLGEPAIEAAQTLGTATNNVAEYQALIHALIRAKELSLARLNIHSDSELLVKQMNGEYRVKHPDLIPLYQHAQSLLGSFEQVTISHVRREQNKRADELCNEVLDAHAKKQPKSPGQAPAAKITAPRRLIGDDRVRDEALICLTAAAQAWSSKSGLSVEMVWDQLWSILQDGGVLKSV
jgi:ribonuclease HI